MLRSDRNRALWSIPKRNNTPVKSLPHLPQLHTMLYVQRKPHYCVQKPSGRQRQPRYQAGREQGKQVKRLCQEGYEEQRSGNGSQHRGEKRCPHSKEAFTGEKGRPDALLCQEGLTQHNITTVPNEQGWGTSMMPKTWNLFPLQPCADFIHMWKSTELREWKVEEHKSRVPKGHQTWKGFTVLDN